MISLEELRQLEQPSVQNILADFRTEKPEALQRLRKKHADLPLRAMSELLRCRQKARVKFPDWPVDELYFDQDGLEMSSSAACAKWRAQHITQVHKKNEIYGIDICAGNGADVLHQKGEWTACEIDPARARMISLNAERLNKTIHVVQDDSIAYLQKRSLSEEKYSALLADPARRNTQQRKQEQEHWVPNIFSHHETIRNNAKHFFFKLPSLSSDALGPWQALSRHYLGLSSECKEMFLSSATDNSTCILLDILGNESDKISLIPGHTKHHIKIYNKELQNGDLLIRPHACLRAAQANIGELQENIQFIGASHQIGIRINAKTSNNAQKLMHAYRIIHVQNCPPKQLKSTFKKWGVQQAQIISIDYPLSAEEIAKTGKIKFGGKHTLLAFKNYRGEKFLALTENN